MVIRSPPTSPTQSRIGGNSGGRRIGSPTRRGAPLCYQEAIEVEHTPTSSKSRSNNLRRRISSKVGGGRRIGSKRMDTDTAATTITTYNNDDEEEGRNEDDFDSLSLPSCESNSNNNSSSNNNIVLETNHDYEVYDENDNLMGCIEVEAMSEQQEQQQQENDGDHGVTISKITFNPNNHEMSDDLILVEDIVDRQQLTNENEESIMDTVLDAFVGQCNDIMSPSLCSEYDSTKLPRKSILKKETTYNDLESYDSCRELNHRSQREVSFDKLQIREYNVTLGDHPNAKTGPPIQLDWDLAKPIEEVDLDTYEQNRQKNNPRRPRRKLKLSFKERERVLLNECGFTKSELVDAWTDALHVRQQRHETIHRSNGMSEKLDEVWESANRKFWRLLQYETI